MVSDDSASIVADPASTSRVGPSAPPRAIASTSAAAARPPTNASAPLTANGSVSPVTAASTTVK